MSFLSTLLFWRRKASPAASPKPYSDGEFDIEGREVFSIERDTEADHTVIGWFVPDGDTGNWSNQEWYLPVSPAKHDELVARFRAKLAVRPVSSVAVESLPSILPPEHSIAPSSLTSGDQVG